MVFGTDISGRILYIDKLSPLVIVAQSQDDTASPVRFVLQDADGNTILDESYFFGFDGTFSVDISDAVRGRFSVTLPDVGTEVLCESVSVDLKVIVGEGALSAEFTVNDMAERAMERVSDIDIVNIPKDYVLPLCIYDFAPRSGVAFIANGCRYGKEGWLSGEGSQKGSLVRLEDVEWLFADGIKSFRVEFLGISPVIASPVYRFVSCHCEQYLFANRFGGFDNVPMTGVLEIAPKYEFDNGVYDGRIRTVSADRETEYVQHSGYMTRQAVSAMMDLICSRQIYHYTSCSFRRIVILETDIATRSEDTLHSFSFRYRYEDQ